MLYPKVVYSWQCAVRLLVRLEEDAQHLVMLPSPAQLNVGLVTRHWANTDLAVITHHIIIDKHWPLFSYTMESGVTEIAVLSLEVFKHLHS